MVCSSFLEDISARVDELIKRGNLSKERLSDQQLNWSPDSALWSPARIFEHMNLANSYYLPVMEKALDQASYGDDKEIRHTLFGSMIIKASGPDGNAPVPKKLIPGPGPYTAAVIDRNIQSHELLAHLCKQADGVDLTSTKVRNPFLPVLGMNLADAFLILARHGERHLGQIEQLMRRSDFPS